MNRMTYFLVDKIKHARSVEFIDDVNTTQIWMVAAQGKNQYNTIFWSDQSSDPKQRAHVEIQRGTSEYDILTKIVKANDVIKLHWDYEPEPILRVVIERNGFSVCSHFRGDVSPRSSIFSQQEDRRRSTQERPEFDPTWSPWGKEDK